MKIIGKYENGNGYIIEDGEARYPIFEESLHVVGIFDSLISAGYRFCGLPYDFRKDGICIDTLPVVKIDVTPEMEQEMFDFCDEKKYSAEELRQRIDTTGVSYLPIPETDYRITTRQEFCAYLDQYAVARNPEDILPINYFVSPEARFTVEEWRTGKCGEQDIVSYFQIMENRRRYTYDQFLMLRSWLMEHGMPKNGDAADFTDAYCQWGLDGINVNFIAKRRKTSYIYDDFLMTAGMDDDAYQITRNELALVDRYGAVFPPEDVPEGFGGWVVNYKRGKESSAFRNKIAGLKEGEYDIVSVSTKDEEVQIEYSTLKETFVVTPFTFKAGKTKGYMFRVTMPDVTASSLNSAYWASKFDQRVLEMSNLRALAYDMVMKRKFVADVSSYKLMTDIGCDINGALRYILNLNTKTEMEKDVADEKQRRGQAKGILTEEEEDDSVTIRVADVNFFTEGNYNYDELPSDRADVIDAIQDVVNGDTNIGEIANGAKDDERINPDEIYKYLYCAHFCKMQISIPDLRKIVSGDLDNKVIRHTNAYGIEDDVLPLQAGGFVLNVPCPEIRGKIDGYKIDRNAVKVKQAEQCCGFLKVVRVASEYGNESKRHIAFEALTVNLYEKGSIAKEYLEKIMEMFEERLSERVPENRRATYRLYKRTLCMAEYFRIAECGCMQFPSELGGDLVQLPFDFALKIGETIKQKITSTAVYCAKMVDADGMLTHYCVNADITPWKIYPRKGIEIPWATLPALWYDWNSMGAPAVKEKLFDQHIINYSYVPWTYRYTEERYFKGLSDLPAVCDLSKYIDECNKFRLDTAANVEFVNAPHLESIIYGFYPDEMARVQRATNLREEGRAPSLHVTVGGTLTQDPEHGKVEAKHYKPANLRRFTGFEAEDFEMLGDVTKVKLPGITENYISVNGDTISTYDRENLPVYMVTQFVGLSYPVIQLYGRKYIFRDVTGSLWEVIV